MYIYQQANWPNFHWNEQQIAQLLTQTKFKQGTLLGTMASLVFTLREQASLKTLTIEVIKTSEIEGEHLNAEEVRSSIARRLGIDIGGLTSANRHIDGIVEMVLDTTHHHDQPLTAERFIERQLSLPVDDNYLCR